MPLTVRRRVGSAPAGPAAPVTVNCDTRPVTVTAGSSTDGHTAEAVGVLAGLDAELAANSQQIGQPLEWSAAESAFRELIADTIDRRVDLQALYADSVDDPKVRLKVCAELRLIETALARLLSRIKTELPAAPSLTSRKASQAARRRWDGDRAKNRG